MTLLTTSFGQGTHAAKPAAAAGNAGRYYFETDTLTLWQSTGSSWTLLANSLELTDGTHDLTSTTKITVSGMTVGGTAVAATLAPNAMVGDSGSGGTAGMVPAPASGDAAAGKYLKASGAWAVPPGGASGLYSAYLCYWDIETSNTDGGTFTYGAWRTRVLNTEASDDGNHGSLANNQITLDAGTYVARISAPACNVGYNKARLHNVTDNTMLLLGTVESAPNGSSATRAWVQGQFTVAASKALEVQHYCGTTVATIGFGRAAGFAGISEIYTVAEFWKVG